jgi:hypothetical protein
MPEQGLGPGQPLQDARPDRLRTAGSVGGFAAGLDAVVHLYAHQQRSTDVAAGMAGRTPYPAVAAARGWLLRRALRDEPPNAALLVGLTVRFRARRHRQHSTHCGRMEGQLSDISPGSPALVQVASCTASRRWCYNTSTLALRCRQGTSPPSLFGVPRRPLSPQSQRLRGVDPRHRRGSR